MNNSVPLALGATMLCCTLAVAGVHTYAAGRAQRLALEDRLSGGGALHTAAGRVRRFAAVDRRLRRTRLGRTIHLTPLGDRTGPDSGRVLHVRRRGRRRAVAAGSRRTGPLLRPDRRAGDDLGRGDLPQLATPETHRGVHQPTPGRGPPAGQRHGGRPGPAYVTGDGGGGAGGPGGRGTCRAWPTS